MHRRPEETLNAFVFFSGARARKTKRNISQIQTVLQSANSHIFYIYADVVILYLKNQSFELNQRSYRSFSLSIRLAFVVENAEKLSEKLKFQSLHVAVKLQNISIEDLKEVNT